jgi:hypothetical protein
MKTLYRCEICGRTDEDREVVTSCERKAQRRRPTHRHLGPCSRFGTWTTKYIAARTITMSPSSSVCTPRRTKDTARE